MDTSTLIELHSQWLTNRKMARLLNCHHKTIAIYLEKNGLQCNWTTSQSLQMIDSNNAICSKCNITYNIEYFQYSHTNKGRLSYCNNCRNKQTLERINESEISYFKYRWSNLKTRAKKHKIIFTLTLDDLIDIYKNQKWLCFYTDVPMSITIGNWLRNNSLSIDKIIPKLWYTKENTVLCIHKVNTCKNNLTLDEIKEWMPKWYQKIINKSF